MAPQRDEIFKQNVNDCVQHIILQKFTNFHAIRSWSFQNIYNDIGWPRFFAPPCIIIGSLCILCGPLHSRPHYEVPVDRLFVRSQLILT